MPQSLALALLPAAPLPARQPPPGGALILDAAAPVIDAVIGGVPVRLRVDLRQWDMIELNGATANRLPLPWQPGRAIAVGRELLRGSTAITTVVIAGRTSPVEVATHDRIVAPGEDGTIGPDLMPYASVTWRRDAAPPATATLALPLDKDARTGFSAAAPGLGGPIRLLFSLELATSHATGAAGSRLAQAFGGRFAGPSTLLPVAFGITRPARPIAFATPPRLAGFRYPLLMVRIGDYRGRNPLPEEPTGEDAIVVARREPTQAAEPWVLIGADRLARCAEIAFSRAASTLTLRCAFDP